MAAEGAPCTGIAGHAPAVEIVGLVKRLGGEVVVDGLDLSVARGDVVGLAGPNGAGKTITMRILLGLVRPDAGVVRILGQRVTPGGTVLARVGALVDGPGFIPHLTGLDNLRIACRLAARAGAEPDLAGAIEVADLGDAMHRRYATYSHGMRYRLGLAQALLGHPDLLLLDEPGTGLDPAHLREIHAVIAAFAARGGTVILSSHVLADVRRVCTRVAIMRSGRLLAEGPVAEILDARGLGSSEDAYLGILSGLPRVLPTEPRPA